VVDGLQLVSVLNEFNIVLHALSTPAGWQKRNAEQQLCTTVQQRFSQYQDQALALKNKTKTVNSNQK